MTVETKSKIIIIGIVIVLGLISLVIFWPNLTKKKPPSVVKKIREEVKGVKVGQDLLHALGESADTDNNSKRPLDGILDNSLQVITNTSSSIIEKIKEEITNVIVEKSSEKIVEKLNQLPDKEKEEVKKNFCK